MHVRSLWANYALIGVRHDIIRVLPDSCRSRPAAEGRHRELTSGQFRARGQEIAAAKRPFEAYGNI